MTAEIINEYGMIIVPIALALIGIVNLLLSQKVHKIVNSAMTQEKTENAMLRSLLTVKQLEVDNAEKARTQLATEAASSKAAVTSTIAPVPPSNEPVPIIIAP